MSGGVSEWYYGNHMFHFHCIFVAQSLTLTGFSWRSRGEAVRWSASPATLKVFYSPSDVQAFLKQKIDYNASNYAGNDVDRFTWEVGWWNWLEMMIMTQEVRRRATPTTHLQKRIAGRGQVGDTHLASCPDNIWTLEWWGGRGTGIQSLKVI